MRRWPLALSLVLAVAAVLWTARPSQADADGAEAGASAMLATGGL